MTNKNCLEGIRCPECGHEDAFRIEAQITVHVTDEGTEEGGDTEWTDASYCECAGCKHAATIKDFTIENHSAKQDDSLRDAAPELVEVLEIALECIDAAFQDGFTEEEALIFDPFILTARAAIAKAKGGAA